MAQAKRHANHQSRAWLPPTVTLALWQVRQTWGLLLITAVGILAAIAFVCAAPLYTTIATSAGLRNILAAAPQNAVITVSAPANILPRKPINKVTAELNAGTRRNLGGYLATPQLSIETTNDQETAQQTAFIPILTNGTPLPSSPDKLIYQETANYVQFVTVPMNQAVQHLTFIQGRAPQEGGDALEIAISSDTARQLNVTVGSIINVHMALANSQKPLLHVPPLVVPLYLVGIFTTPAPTDFFWQGDNSLTEPDSYGFHPVLASTATFMNVFNQYTQQLVPKGQIFKVSFYLHWYYPLAISRITSNDLDALLHGFVLIQSDNGRNADLNQQLFQGDGFIPPTTTPTNIVQAYQNQIQVAQIPAISLVLLIGGLILYFLSVMAGFLIERQTTVIAVLRSRGASPGQIAGSLLLQSGCVGLIATCCGPFLAMLMVRFLTAHVLPFGDLGALDFILRNPLQVALGLGWLALATFIVTLVAMVATINQVAFRDVLAMRREAARATRSPFWQRFNLDIAALLIVLIGYVFSGYITDTNVLNIHQRLLLLTPLVLLRTIFLLIAGLLLFLRFFPILLQVGSWLTTRRRDAAAMIAMAQIARTPRYSVRFTLLLALTTAFALFTFVLGASQYQRTYDVASFTSAADFSGVVPLPYDAPQLANVTNAYRHQRGVSSATLGFVTSRMITTFKNPVTVMAVDTSTFASTAIWTQQNAEVPLAPLFHRLTATWQADASHKAVPAIVDAALWDSLHLSPNTTFTLADHYYGDFTIPFVAVAKVAHILNISGNGVLIDYQIFSQLYKQYAIVHYNYDQKATELDHVWLRTSDDPIALASVRAALAQGALQLDALIDRRGLVASLQQEPLYVNIVGILTLGVIITLLLAIGGCLLASWLNARSRVTFFAVLRALGAAPGQIASTLTWEQGVIYTTAILLGIGFGALLSSAAVPLLIFSSSASGNMTNEEFYAAQNAPPIQIIIPSLLGIVLAAIVAICFIALSMMIRIVSRPSLSQTLRLNED